MGFKEFINEYFEEGYTNKGGKGDKEEYQQYFNSKLKEYGVDDPEDIKDDDEKKKFFNDVDNGWKADDEDE